MHKILAPPMEGSRFFLMRYMDSLMIKQLPDADIVKGKMVISLEVGFEREKSINDGW
jgi:hypothetical protein